MLPFFVSPREVSSPAADTASRPAGVTLGLFSSVAVAAARARRFAGRGMPRPPAKVMVQGQVPFLGRLKKGAGAFNAFAASLARPLGEAFAA